MTVEVSHHIVCQSFFLHCFLVAHCVAILQFTQALVDGWPLGMFPHSYACMRDGLCSLLITDHRILAFIYVYVYVPDTYMHRPLYVKIKGQPWVLVPMFQVIWGLCCLQMCTHFGHPGVLLAPPPNSFQANWNLLFDFVLFCFCFCCFRFSRQGFYT